MQLPFTETQFLDNFGAFNAALWPVLAALWVASLVLALDHDVDLHLAVSLLERGCPADTALQILF